MPLGEPPDAATLRGGIPPVPLANLTLHRVRRREFGMWWFASLPPPNEGTPGGRFDLPAPDGSCYFGTTALAGVLEHFQLSTPLLPDVELRKRLRGQVTVPAHGPGAADLTDPRCTGAGVTTALWGGGPGDRPLTQRWAAQLHDAGWDALHHGIQHDPSGRLRGVTLFGDAGDEPPSPAGDWDYADHELAGDEVIVDGLRQYNVAVVTSQPDLPVVPLEQSGLLDDPEQM